MLCYVSKASGEQSESCMELTKQLNSIATQMGASTRDNLRKVGDHLLSGLGRLRLQKGSMGYAHSKCRPTQRPMHPRRHSGSVVAPPPLLCKKSSFLCITRVHFSNNRWRKEFERVTENSFAPG